jgi:hypothetical protein
MFTINEDKIINLDEVSETLAILKVDKLHIVSIVDTVCTEFISTRANKGSPVIYAEVDIKTFIDYLNNGDNAFIKANPDTLYIIRGGHFLDLKNLLSAIRGYRVTVGRGGSQKSHMLSPLDLRLTFYLMAMFNFNHDVIKDLNGFNHVDKSRYLSYTENLTRYNKNNVSIRKVLSKL